MADLDLNEPLPDRAHDALRRAVLAAIGDLQTAQADSGDAFYLIDGVFDLIDALFAQVDTLTARLDALEPAVYYAEDADAK
jgi:hypothetical protein